ncbi:glycosyltransferase [Modicisalibacter tunisiensis]|uniref:glycosyltransferase family 2 protein n=1 Tax=Modicisalibacter tunisiensis TaxID=390637 RepID=UPI001CCDB6C2|nr:glycosyltransferase [Modicisalibacter tunisiensis]MBZ9539957.1 glycosyltransferase [Modicisalibacter tunisiensis]
MTASSDGQGRLTGLYGNLLKGWAWDAASPGRRWAIAIHGDGRPLALAQAEDFHPEAPGDGAYGFSVVLSDAQLDACRQLTLTLANAERPLDTLTLPAAPPANRTPEHSRVHWQPGLVLRGWLVDTHDPQRQASIEVHEQGQRIARTTPTRWDALPTPAGEPHERVEGGFQIRLPLSLADGRRHVLTVRDDQGRELAGSPVVIQEWPEGLAHWQAHAATESQRTLLTRQLERYEQLLPRGVDPADYPAWLAAFPVTPPEVPSHPSPVRVGVIQLGSGALHLPDTPALGVRTWVIDAPDDTPAYQQAISDACRHCDAIAQLEPGDRLAEGALARAWQVLHEQQAAIVYSDFDAPARQPDAPRQPGFLPAWDPDRHWCQDFLSAGLCLVRSDVLRDHPRPPATPGELTYAAVERCDAEAIWHLPEPLRHRARPWAEDGLADAPCAAEHLERLQARLAHHDPLATLAAHPSHPGLRRLTRRLDDWPAVALIVPTRDALGLLTRCLDTLLAHTDYPGQVHVLIVDNQSQRAETRAYFAEQTAAGTRPLGRHGGRLKVEVLAYPHAFNYAAINNAAVAHLTRTHGEAAAPVIGLLNNDIECLHDDWLCRLVALLMRPGTGAVGAKLQWPNGMVQHGGVIGGVHGLAAHIGNAWQNDDAGHLGMNHLTQRFSAVTAACLLMRRADYQAIGGLDARDFPVGFNDVDLCLKLRARGQAVVWTPEARLIHAESATRGKDESAEKAARAQREMANLRRRWSQALLNDPAYNPNFSLDTASDPFTSLALPPRERRARNARLPR